MHECVKQPSVRCGVIHVALCVFTLLSFILLNKPGHTTTTFNMVVPSSSDATYKGSLQALAKTVFDNSNGGLKLDIKYTKDSSVASRINLVTGNHAQITAITSGALPIPALQQYFLLHGPYEIPLLLAAFSPPHLKYIGASFRGTFGFVGTTSYTAPEQFNGVRIAAKGDISPLRAKWLKTTPSETLAGFVAGQLDGFETRLLSPMLTKLLGRKDVTLTITNHRFWSDAYFINSESFDGLPPGQRTTLINAFDEHRRRHGKVVVEMENTFLQKIRSRVSAADVPAYKALFSPVWKKHLKDGDLHPLLTGGGTGCSSTKKCKCKTDTYAKKCTCHEDCKKNNDCKDKT